MQKIKSKKAAFEMSVSTIVYIVLGMTLLILGLVFIRTIFKSGIGTIDIADEKVKGEINKLFVEDTRAVIYLPNKLAEIKPGKVGDVAFAIQNKIKSQEFSYKVTVNDKNIRKKCGVTEREAEEWMSTGSEGSAGIDSGQKYYDFIRFNIPEGEVDDISECIVRFKIEIKKEDGSAYETINFDAPLVKLEENIYCLELFHGPTLAFKDFGARFMSRLISYFNKEETLILVATSGDTGSAVGEAYRGLNGIKVFILYPKSEVTPVQKNN